MKHPNTFEAPDAASPKAADAASTGAQDQAATALPWLDQAKIRRNVHQALAMRGPRPSPESLLLNRLNNQAVIDYQFRQTWRSRYGRAKRLTRLPIPIRLEKILGGRP